MDGNDLIITICEIHIESIMKYEHKEQIVATSEFVDKLINKIREKYPNQFSNEQIEQFRNDLLKSIFKV